MFVKDAVKATLFFHDHPEVSGIFNCGTGKARTWLDLVNAVFAAMKREPRITFVDMPDDDQREVPVSHPSRHFEAEEGRIHRAVYVP